MIVRAAGEELWLFDQNDHAALCGEMARAWGAAPFAAAPPPVQRAAAFHDNGWREWDARPRLDPGTGHPHPYSRMPAEDYLEIWRRGLARAWEEGEEVGLLVSLHAMRFFGRKTRPEDQAFYAEQQGRQAQALARLDAPSTDPQALPRPYATSHAWVFFWDALSLFLCERWKSLYTHSVPGGAEETSELRVEHQGGAVPGGEVALAPFPFRGPLVLEATARVIPLRVYPTQAALDAALVGAGRRTARWTLGPAER